MKPFNLEEYLKDPSKKVVRRDGMEVRIICTDKKSEHFPVVALVKDKCGNEHVVNYTADGKFLRSDAGVADLFFVPKKKEGWVNIYKTHLSNGIYSTKEEALQKILEGLHYITTVKIKWEE